MSFLWPPMLAAVLLVPLGLLAYRAIDDVRRRRLAALIGPAGSGVRAGARPGLAGSLRTRVPPILFAAGFTILAVALARPQASLALPRPEGTVILAFDVSASMAADDVKPTRLDAAKAAARAFVANPPPGVVIGLVAFSDAGLSVQVPTSDEVALDAAIDRLTPAHGTSLGQGMLAALGAVTQAESDTPPDYYSNRSPAPSPSVAPVAPGSHDSAVIVLLSDGENNETPDPVTAAQAVADRGVRIDTVGIGTSAGATLDLGGFRVHSQLDEATLQRVAELTQGQYFSATDTSKLRSVYDTLGSSLVVKSEPLELTGLLAGASLLLFVAGGVTSLAWLGRLP